MWMVCGSRILNMDKVSDINICKEIDKVSGNKHWDIMTDTGFCFGVFPNPEEACEKLIDIKKSLEEK